ncbi:2-amino-4-hydroxy-6-hydroxymethyldihydropteridine diphosphokinase [Desulfonatronospira sp.]|uniref:2-amino-4-hydroxy-6- hydroxymethyldihydropteridine diphosphokinase n=1 Tax=Desulfonatronospira sp. TaxID=1962951 RepID=UPI0025C0E962|nr:2-amino-4-hydroxy-6-hydroxymethyldihydropteridine diphosphokinase [Desulfonatronospira sp.]
MHLHKQDIFISLGSNMGDPTDNLKQASDLVQALPGLSVVKESSIYRTEPQGLKDQDWFANQVLWMRRDKSWHPRTLLAELKEMEKRLGRIPGPRNGPRLIDLDMLLFGNTIMSEEDLILPHPGLKSRAFVLIPLVEVCPGLILPDGSKAESLLQGLEFRLEGHKIFQT